MPLEEYKRKRRFSKTPEPEGKVGKRSGRRFVIQKHAASRLHYDFRLELDGVLKSWAVPKGPSLDPSEKRLAVHVEDHPIEYGDFEGVIPQGEYGGGTVVLWDRGEWEPWEDADEGYRAGKLKFNLHGEKLHGGWTLVRMRSRGRDEGDNWLLIKERDEAARPLEKGDILTLRPESVASGRTLEQIQENPERNWRSRDADRDKKQKSLGKKFATRLKKLKGPKKARIPDSITPQLATGVEKAPAGDEWFHEIKLDGYRVIAFVNGGNVTLQTRKGLNWTGRFPEIAKAVASLPVESVILDGEIISQLPSGLSSFSALQEALSKKKTAALAYYLFDLLYLNGQDLRQASLEQRKKLLAELLEGVKNTRLQYIDHIVGNGPEFLAKCCAAELEGSICKRRDRPYVSGRGRDWLKVKCRRTLDVVIGGFTRPKGSRSGLGALLTGQYDHDGSLIFTGRVGSGFTEKVLDDVHRRLKALQRKSNPFGSLTTQQAPRGTTWVEPQLVAHVEYSDWTHDKVLRQATFQGLREDVEPRSVLYNPSEVVKELARRSPRTPRGANHA